MMKRPNLILALFCVLVITGGALSLFQQSDGIETSAVVRDEGETLPVGEGYKPSAHEAVSDRNSGRRYLLSKSSTVPNVSLGTAGRITGKVVAECVNQDFDALTAFAWRVGSRVSPDDIRLAYAGHGKVLTASVNSRGAFEIRNAVTDTEYSLAVGGFGWVSQRIVRCHADMAETVTVVAWRVYGCGVKVRDSAGGEVPLSRTFAAITRRSELVDGAVLVLPNSIDAALAKMVSIHNTKKFDWRNHLIGYKSPHHPNREVELYFNVPGFSKCVARLPLFKLTMSMPIRTIFLARTTRGFGKLRVRLMTPIGRVNPGTGWGPAPAILRLLADEGRDKNALEVPFYDLGMGERVIKDIPYGRYRFQFSASAGKFQYPELKQGMKYVTIGDYQAELDIDIGALGALELITLNSNGKQINIGPISVEVTGGSPKTWSQFLFKGPPYQIQALQGGEYEIGIRKAGEERVVKCSSRIAEGVRRKERVIWSPK